MNTAKNALQELSQDPESQRMARERETAVLMQRHLVTASLEKGREEGREVALMAIRSMCKILNVELDANENQRLESLNIDELKNLIKTVETERHWPLDRSPR